MSKWQKVIAYYAYGPLFFESSILHQAYHFVVPLVSKKNRTGTIRSVLIALVGGYFVLNKLAAFGSLWTIYAIPFLVFQFWLSTFTYFHHRNTESAGWKQDEDWDKVYGALLSTIHVDYPTWVEFLTLNINWHLPHHVCSSVPWYNLRRATFSMAQAYGKQLHFAEFGWKLWSEVTTGCHVYDKEKGYVPMEW